MPTTFSRKKRSSRKRPRATSLSRSRFVAATTRTSTLRVVASRRRARTAAPRGTGGASPAARAAGSPTSSRKTVPPRGGLEASRLVLPGAGERALHVPEELALEEMLGERRAGMVTNGPVAPRAPAVHRRREHVLPGAALAGEEDGHVRGGRLPRRGERPLHGRARRLEQRPARSTARAQRAVLAPEPLHLEHPLEQQAAPGRAPNGLTR